MRSRVSRCSCLVPTELLTSHVPWPELMGASASLSMLLDGPGGVGRGPRLLGSGGGGGGTPNGGGGTLLDPERESPFILG